MNRLGKKTTQQGSHSTNITIRAIYCYRAIPRMKIDQLVAEQTNNNNSGYYFISAAHIVS